MAGNSQRRGAVRKAGSKKGAKIGSGGWGKGSDEHLAQLYDLETDTAESKNRLADQPDVVRKLNDLMRWTGWSYRGLAAVIGSSHPTIAQALEGQWDAIDKGSDHLAQVELAQRLHDAESTGLGWKTEGILDATKNPPPLICRIQRP